MKLVSSKLYVLKVFHLMVKMSLAWTTCSLGWYLCIELRIIWVEERKDTRSYIVEDYLGRREKIHTVLYS